MRRWVFKVHLWIGALAGGFSVVLGITGSILAFELPLDHVLNAKFSYISPSSRDLPLSQILRSVQASFPSDNIAAVVAFDVNDGITGFPCSVLERTPALSLKS